MHAETAKQPLKKIAIINQKGGVGKTTAAVNPAGAYAEAGYRILLVDCDSQGDLHRIPAPARGTSAFHRRHFCRQSRYHA